MERKVLETIKKYEMFSPGDRVIAGVSGGPDSAALLFVLSRLSKELKLSLHVAHLDHMIRGKASKEDMKHVIQMTKKLNVPITCKEFDVKSFAKKEKLSLEDAARRARYSFFEDLLKETSASTIALGHNFDDNVETVLMRLVTGTGTRGLLGIPPKRGRIVRPLIECSRDEIETYCRKHKLKWRVDKSNFDTKFLRNKVRHKLIPVLKTINPNVRTAVGQAIELLHSDYDYLMDISTKALHGATIKKTDGSIKLDIDKLLMYPDSIRRYVLRAAIEDVKGNLENVTFNHINDISVKLPDDESWELHLPNGIFVFGNGDCLAISASRPKEEYVRFEHELKVPGSVRIKDAQLELKAEVSEVPKKLKINDKNVAYVDLGKTGQNLIVRSRRVGDRFSPFGIPGSKKLSDFLIDEKVSSDKKDKVPIVEAKGNIVWVAGHRADDRFKVTKDTKKILRLTLGAF